MELQPPQQPSSETSDPIIKNIYPEPSLSTNRTPVSPGPVSSEPIEGIKDSKRPPLGLIALCLPALMGYLFVLLGPGDVFVRESGHIALHHYSFLAPFQAMFVAHASFSKVFFNDIVGPLVGIALVGWLLKLSETARILTLVLLILPFVGLSISMLLLLKGAHFDPFLTKFLVALWLYVLTVYIYLTRPQVKEHFH